MKAVMFLFFCVLLSAGRTVESHGMSAALGSRSHNPRVRVGTSQILATPKNDLSGGARAEARADSNGRSLFRRAPLRLPSEPNPSSAPEESRPAPGGYEFFPEAFRRGFPIFAASIIAVLGALMFKSWRQTARERMRENNYRAIIERDWQSVGVLRSVLEKTEDFHHQAKDWTPAQLNTFRENDVGINGYDYDSLWNIWKRYEVRGFEPEIRALKNSKWNEQEITELLTVYIREMKARWEILSAIERGRKDIRTHPAAKTDRAAGRIGRRP